MKRALNETYQPIFLLVGLSVKFLHTNQINNQYNMEVTAWSLNCREVYRSFQTLRKRRLRSRSRITTSLTKSKLLVFGVKAVRTTHCWHRKSRNSCQRLWKQERRNASWRSETIHEPKAACSKVQCKLKERNLKPCFVEKSRASVHPLRA